MKNKILEQTDGGLTFFQYVFKRHGQKVVISGNRSKNLHSPFYTDKNPSFSIYYNSSSKRWYFKDYGNAEHQGDVFTFAAFLFDNNIKSEFPEILKKMDRVLKRDDYEIGSNWEPIKQEQHKEKKEFNIQTIPFSVEAKDYFSQYDIDLNTLEQHRVIEINNYTVKRVRRKGNLTITKRNGNLIFAYLGDGYAKVYRPTYGTQKKSFYWLGNKPKNYTFGLEDVYENGDPLILVGGEKDVLTLKAMGINAFCLSSEVLSLDKRTLKDIFYSGAQLMVMYDLDDTGIKEGAKRAKECSCPQIILPDELKLKGGKDISDWVKLGLPVSKIHELIKQQAA